MVDFNQIYEFLVFIFVGWSLLAICSILIVVCSINSKYWTLVINHNFFQTTILGFSHFMMLRQMKWVSDITVSIQVNLYDFSFELIFEVYNRHRRWNFRIILCGSMIRPASWTLSTKKVSIFQLPNFERMRKFIRQY